MSASGLREASGEQTDVAALDDGRVSKTMLLGLAVAAVLLVVVPVGLSRVVSQPAPVTYTIEIPRGTAARIGAGEDVEIFPGDLDFKLRDQLVIVNDDTTLHRIGPFVVEPGDRIERSFADATEITGFCTLHPNGGISFQIAK